MALNVGSRLGHYEVTALIGEGGMGQVYQATDTKLNRQVALKILPEAFATDPDRLARFQREAQVLASLNHPNIAQIHGIEEQEGTRALVLELVEGPTLADRIAKGPIPLDEALPIAKQIAEALEAAHEAGVIHRDLKPANIKVREDGTVKVLDFGLAKALDTTAQGDPSESPTLTAAATQMGVIMGTAAYMSPEQARGKAADYRSDVWAFGAVVYEMLTGHRVFESEDVSLTLADVMRAEPDWELLPDELSPVVASYLKRCLQKEPRQRVQAMGDVRLALGGGFSLGGVASSDVGPPSPPSWRWSPALAGFLLGAIVAAATAWSLIGGSSAVSETRYLAIGVAPAEQLGSTRGGQSQESQSLSRIAFAVSPDGQRLVFAGMSGATEQLYVRSLQEAEARAIPGTSGAINPFFSPDGQSVGFWAGGQLMKVSLAGGLPVPLASTSRLSYGASWGDANTIVFATRASGLFAVSSDGGTPAVLTPLAEDDPPGTVYFLPWVLPGRDAVLFTRLGPRRAWENAQIIVHSVTTDERKVLIEGGANPIYASSGHLLFVRLGVLWAAPFDLEALEVTGTAVPVVEDITQSAQISNIYSDSGASQVGISATGTLVYLPGGLLAGDERELVWVDRQGVKTPLGLPAGEYWQPRVSPDGRYVAIDATGNARQTTIYDIRRAVSQILPGSSANVGAWMPDGTRVLFSRTTDDGPRNLYSQAPDGTQAERLTTSPKLQWAGAVSADGSELVLVERSPGGLANHSDILRLRLEPRDEAPVALFSSPSNEMYPALSPDDRWLAYGHDGSGQMEVSVVRYPELDQAVQVSANGGLMPTWSANGDELFYLVRGASLADQDVMMAVDVATTDGFEVGVPRELFRGDYQFGGQVRTYDLAPDGRFLMLERSTRSFTRAATPLRLVENWFSELERLVPTN